MARNACPSDLTEDQWKEIRPLIPPAIPGGRHRAVDMRAVLNGVLYLSRTGCSWRQLPHDTKSSLTLPIGPKPPYRVSGPVQPPE